ncbi:hypothetical protein AGLY_016299 [Aphis glycines]|uniref:Uncharacterized protein n=1 Tax=Aphis glycines TaxID=307491 RepID=A0A6G0T096_APHGL|nr:hypothetical protein AGLY_016299 [Aphis glycines]
MNFGFRQLETSILPSANDLIVAKSKELKLRHRHSDSLRAILIMKAYSKSASYPTLIIDATGIVIKKFSKLGLIKTQTLYLYEAVVYDDDRNHAFKACSISERHDNIDIYNSLSRWLKSGIPPPKETCCDMSLALLSALVRIASNETSGGNVEMGIETPCSKHKNKLIEAASGGFTSYTNEFQDIISGSEIEEGTDLNPLYLPSIIPLIKKEIKMLPLWSRIMIPIFGYGSLTKLSAAVESTFHKLKNVIFKDIDLPTTLETFIERRLTSLKGSALLYDNDIEKCTSTISEDPIDNNSAENYSMVNSVCTFSKPVYDIYDCTFHHIDSDTIEVCNDYVVPPNHKKIFNNEENNNLLDGNSEKSSTSKQTIDEFFAVLNKKELNINNISSTDDSDGSNSNESLNSGYVFQNNTLTQRNDELHIQEQPINTATEKWKRKNHKQTKSYLTPNSHLKHLNLNIKNNNKVLPLLKNGSRAEDLKALNLKGYGKIILTNTCAFDTAVSFFMAAMCDSNKYLKRIDQFPSNSFITFTKTILSTGISVDTYRNRAKIIIETQAPVQTPLKYGQIILYKCETTFSLNGSTSHIVKLSEIPSKTEIQQNKTRQEHQHMTKRPLKEIKRKNVGQELENNLICN